MATATHVPSALLSLDEYLNTAYHPDCDFVDGVLEERTAGEREHSILQIALGAWFFNHRQEWNIIAMSEQRTRITDSKVRLPDICLVAADAPREAVTVTPPLLAVELLSREDRLPRVMTRLSDFLDMGVLHVWLLDPMERVAYTYVDHQLKLAGPRLEVAGTPIFVDLAELFSCLD